MRAAALLVPLALLAAALAAAAGTARASSVSGVELSDGATLEPAFATDVTSYRVVLGAGVSESWVNASLSRGTADPPGGQLVGAGSTLVLVAVDPVDGNLTFTFRAETRGAACSLLSFCNGNGDCEEGATEAGDRCECFRGFEQESCDVLDTTWENFMFVFVWAALIGGAAACGMSLMAAAASGFSGEIYTPLNYVIFLQQFVLFVSHNEDSRQFFDPYQIMNFLILNLFRDEGGTERNGSYLVYMHGVSRKCVLFLLVVALYVWLPGRYLVTCMFKAHVKAQHLTWVFVLLFVPMADTMLDFVSSGRVEPSDLRWAVLAAILAAVWAFALLVVRPHLNEDVRLFLLPGAGGWGRFRVNKSMRREDESFWAMVRRKVAALCTTTYVPPGERKHRKRWRCRFWIYPTEEEANRFADPDEVEEMTAARARQAVLVTHPDERAQRARARAESEAAVTTIEEAAGVVAADEAQKKRAILEDFVPIANLSQIKMVGPDDADEDAVTDREANAWDSFQHQNLFSRIAYYAPFTPAQAAEAGLPRRALRFVRSTAGLYYTFVELSFLAAVVVMATWHDGEAQPRQMMYVYAAELLVLLVLVPFKNDEMVVALAVRSGLIAQLWMFRRMLRDREEVGLMLPISAVMAGMLPLTWLAWAYFNEDKDTQRRRRNAVIVMKGHIRRRRAAAAAQERQRLADEEQARLEAEAAEERLQEREVELQRVFVPPGRRGKATKAAGWFDNRDAASGGIVVKRTVVVRRPPEKKRVDYDEIDLEAGAGAGASDADEGPMSVRGASDKKKKRKKKQKQKQKQGGKPNAAEEDWMSSESEADDDEPDDNDDEDDGDGSDSDSPRGPPRAAPPANLSQHNLLDFLKQQSADEAARKRYESTQKRRGQQ